MDQKTFHARYEGMPEGFRAELIGGVVYLPSPAKAPHGRGQSLVSGWLGTYEASTSGTQALNKATVILGPVAGGNFRGRILRRMKRRGRDTKGQREKGYQVPAAIAARSPLFSMRLSAGFL